MASPSIASLLQPYTPPPLRDSFNRLSELHSPDITQQDSSTRSTAFIDAGGGGTTSECSDCGDVEASSPSYAWNSATEQPHCSAAAAAERQPPFPLEWQRASDEEGNSQHSRSFSGDSAASTATSIDPHQLGPAPSMVKHEEYGDSSQATDSISYMSSQQFISDAMEDAMAAAATAAAAAAAAAASASVTPDLPAPTPARFTTSLQVQQTQEYHYHSSSTSSASNRQQQVASTPRSLPTLDIFAALNAPRPPDAAPTTYMRPYEPRQPYYMPIPAPSQPSYLQQQYLQQQQQHASSSSSALREQQQAFGVHPTLPLSSNAGLSGSPPAFFAPPGLKSWSTAPGRHLPPPIFGAHLPVQPEPEAASPSSPTSAAPSLFYPALPTFKQAARSELDILQDASLYDGAASSSPAPPASSEQKEKHKEREEEDKKEEERESLYRPAKRRKNYDEVQRKYFCDFEGCTKSYGTLGHLNHHRDMTKHGPRIRQIELDRKAKEEVLAAEAAAQRAAVAAAQLAASQTDSLNTPSPEPTPVPESKPGEHQGEQATTSTSRDIMAPGSWIPSSVALALYDK